MSDKHDIIDSFRKRLALLVERRGEPLTRFAERCGVDRSALSQFLDARTRRLPRAETLCAIAQAEAVSVDWLLGLSQSERSLGEVAPQLGIEASGATGGESALARWHREAVGAKIRYVPATLPDLTRTPALIDFEFRAQQASLRDAKADAASAQLDWSRRPETDMEVAMPRQRMEAFAAGQGIWAGLPPGVRRAQLDHMAALLDELYPTLRLFLHDGLAHYSAPFTVFGHRRAAVYLGSIYLVVNSAAHIRELAARFDGLVRVAQVGADRAADWVGRLRVP